MIGEFLHRLTTSRTLNKRTAETWNLSVITVHHFSWRPEYNVTTFTFSPVLFFRTNSKRLLRLVAESRGPLSLPVRPTDWFHEGARKSIERSATRKICGIWRFNTVLMIFFRTFQWNETTEKGLYNRDVSDGHTQTCGIKWIMSVYKTFTLMFNLSKFVTGDRADRGRLICSAQWYQTPHPSIDLISAINPEYLFSSYRAIPDE